MSGRTETVVRLDVREDAAAANFQQLAQAAWADRLRLETEPAAGCAPVTNEKAQTLLRELLDGETPPVNDRYWREQRNVAMAYRDREEVVVDGGGITLLCDGLMQPVAFWNCGRVTVRNLGIDWRRPLFSVGTVVEADPHTLVFRPLSGCGQPSAQLAATPAMSPDSRLSSGTLLPPDSPSPDTLLQGGEPVVSFQTARADGVPSGICLFEGIGRVQPAKEAGCFQIHSREAIGPVQPGDKVILRHIYSYAPVCHLFGCRDVRIEDVRIHAGPGMGIIAHRCGDIHLERLRVEPSGDRVMSTNCDATHFISCSGEIRINGCTFRGMGDDAANVHGFYLTVRRIADRRLVVSLDAAPQDFEMDLPDPGDELELVRPDTLLPYGACRVRQVRWDGGSRQVELELTADLPPEAALGDLLANRTKAARLIFENNTAENIRGRAVLVQTRHAVVRDNRFVHCTGQGVHVDTATGWMEALGTRDIRIERNRFLACGYGQTKYCDAAGVVVETECERPAVGVHRGITIADNCIQGANHGVVVRCAEDVQIRGNTFETAKAPIVLGDCGAVSVAGNRFVPFGREADEAAKTHAADP